MAAENSETPRHVAIIMDGNGRWAEKLGRERTWGHEVGAEVAMNVLEHVVLKHPEIDALTLWGFSTENWRRSNNEVNALMRLFMRFGVRKAHRLDKANILVKFVGRRDPLPDRLQRIMNQVEERTRNNDGLLLRPAINFSATQEYVDAANRLHERGEIISDQSMIREIYGEVPFYDLVIRTGGEERTSDFPIGHGELFVTDTLWPDFTANEFDKILMSFVTRERRFGGESAQKVS